MGLFNDDPSVETAAPAKSAQVKRLEKEILRHRDLYYKGNPELSDDDYDRLEEELREIAPDSPVLKAVGTTKVVKNEVTLPVAMPSLNKVRPDTGADTWLQTHKGPYVVSDKLDGVSIELVYAPGKQVQAYTRGDGERGGDISYMTPHLDIPQKLRKSLILRGEIIMSKANFERWSHVYKNARNLAAGLTNRKDIHDAVPDLHVVIYGVLKPRGVPDTMLEQVEAMGFQVVPYRVFKTLTVAQLQKLFTTRKAKSRYDVDGLVIEQNISTPAPTVNPDHAVAFKDTLAVDSAIVSVDEVTWEESRYGKLTPRVWFDAVRLSGVDVGKATGHNAKFILDNRIGVGAQIKVIRSGDVIPYIAEVVKPARRAAMPPGKEGVDWDWNDTGVDIFVHKAQGVSDTSKIRQLSHFFATMDVDGLRGGMLTKLYDAGFTEVNQILRAKPAEYAPAIGPNNAQKIGAEIRAKLKQVYPADLAYAWGGFGRAIGSTVLWSVWSHLGNAGVQALLKKSAAQRTATLAPIEGIGPTRAKAVADNLDEFFAFAKALPCKMVEYEEPEVELKSTRLDGQSVAFTGFRDAQLVELIQQHGGSASDSIGKATTILLTKDPASGSSKVQTALKRGIPVMTPQEFKKKYRL